MDACIKKNVDDVFLLLDEMSSCGVKPNHITCSILLKTIRAGSSARNVERVLNVMDSVAEERDEVLLSSVVEACIRAGRVDLLVPHLKRQCSSRKIQVRGPHTYGSIIRAYGFVNDIAGAWETWREMRTRKIVPTAVTLGCMVEAVVSSGDPEAGYELIQDVLSDEQCKPLVNAVIYCSVLKGFSHQKKFDRFWEVYQEMLVQKVTFSIVTFNTMVDACSRCGEMSRIPELLRIMVSQGIEPNLITYSAIIKGHCQMGNVQLGFSVLKEMQRDARFKPDEIMYNSLLDGCAQNNLYEEGHDLLKEMLHAGVAPSNFTLSIMVKMLNRARKVEEAFQLVEEITRQYKFKPNLHVYTNLIQGCICSRQLSRALEVLKTMVKSRVAPDCRTYGVLIRACFYQDDCEQAAALLRSTLGLTGGYQLPDSRLATCFTVDSNLVNETLASLADRGWAKDLAAPLLADIKQSKVKVSIDQGTQRRVMSGVTDVTASGSWSSSKGKGKGRVQRQGW
jgi:pentatricopeptide repeat protein